MVRDFKVGDEVRIKGFNKTGLIIQTHKTDDTQQVLYVATPDYTIVINSDKAELVFYNEKFKFKYDEYVKVISSDKFNGMIGTVKNRYVLGLDTIIYYIEIIQHKSKGLVSDFINISESELKLERVKTINLNPAELIENLYNGSLLTGATITSNNSDIGKMKVVSNNENNRMLINRDTKTPVELNYDFFNSEFTILDININWSYN